MNELIAAIGGVENVPYVLGGVTLVLVLIAVKWLSGGEEQPEKQVTGETESKHSAEDPQTQAPSADATVAKTASPSSPESGAPAAPSSEPAVAAKAEAEAEEQPAGGEVQAEFNTLVDELQGRDPAAKAQPPEVAEARADQVQEPVAETGAESEPEQAPRPAPQVETAAEAPEVRKARLFSRIKQGLSRTKANLSDGLSGLFLGAKEIDEDLLEEIETQLLMADVGVEATARIIERLTERVARKQLGDAEALYLALKEELRLLLGEEDQPLVIDGSRKPYVILMVGVNGVGKTTTIGKLAKRFQAEGRSVMLAAGDTFRAAAVEQLQVWGERNQVPVVAQHTGADSASVIFDAVQSAQSRGIDVVIADTAGRLQNKANLMAELEKVVRVMRKLDDSAPHEVMLVLDAGTGQNALNQAKQFQEAVGVTGISLTKLDGTAKGGIIFAIAQQCGLPIRFIGVGEQIDDLRPFNAVEFIDALFAEED